MLYAMHVTVWSKNDMISPNDDVLTVLDKIALIIVSDNYRNVVIPIDKKTYKDSIEFAKEKGCYVYYGELLDGSIKLPYYLDTNSIPKSKKETKLEPNAKEPELADLKIQEVESDYKKNEAWAESLICPKCGKTCSSKSGYTLHLKSCK